MLLHLFYPPVKCLFEIKMKLLLIGPRYHSSGKLGGVVVLFELLIKELQNQGIEVITIDMNKNNYRNVVSAVFCIYFSFLRYLPRISHVSFHGTAGNYIFVALFVVFVSRLFRKKVSLRKFAGSFREVYENANWLSQWLIRHSLKNATVLFFETKYLVQYFSKFNPNTYWLPNYRPRPQVKKTTRSYNKKFVFLGHVKKEKGVLELLDAADHLGTEYQVDIYGTMVEPLEEKIANSKAEYRGVIEPENVPKVLSEYDVLVLPSFREGYPGVIIEAFSVGIPVVATSLGGIKEMVEHGKSGILVKQKNVEDLVTAMQKFNTFNYSFYSTHALKSFEKYESQNVTRFFLEKLFYKG